jgi:hypothetical protein
MTMTNVITKSGSGEWMEFEFTKTEKGTEMKQVPIQMHYHDGVICKDLHSKTFDVFIGGWTLECQTLEEAKAYIRDFMGINR